MIDYLSGAITMAYLVSGVFFLRFWRKTRDRFFAAFAVAFWLFAFNQILSFAVDTSDERSGYIYIFRVIGFVIILLAIADKNTAGSGKPR